jgi:type II secretory pathway pseudopilin PulG
VSVRGRDAGTSLTELVVTILIMGIVITPVMNAVIGVIKASATNRGLAQVETVLTNAADQVNRANPACDYTGYAQVAVSPLGWPPGSVTIEQRHYVPGPTPAVTGTWESGACTGAVPEDLLVQLVSITVRNPETGAQRTIQVVKSSV